MTREEAIAETIRSLCAECAGKTFYWMTRWRCELLDDPTNVGDLEHPLATQDVKAVRSRRHQLISPAAAIRPNWIYQMVSTERAPDYWIGGWCYGRELAAAPLVELQPGRPCHALAADAPVLREPEVLRQLLLTVPVPA